MKHKQKALPEKKCLQLNLEWNFDWSIYNYTIRELEFAAGFFFFF